MKLVEPLEAYLERHGLTIQNRTCLSCKKDFPVDDPVFIKGYRGLRMKDHGCDKKYLVAIFKPTSKDEIKFWMDFKYGK